MGFGSLRPALGHSYRDLHTSGEDLNTGWGFKFLNTLWSSLDDPELRSVALIDLLFETENRESLYGFFSLSKRLRPLNGDNVLVAYGTLLETMGREGLTVGSHPVFKRGLPSIGQVLLATEAQFAECMGENIDHENYLHAAIEVGVQPLSEEVRALEDILAYEDLRHGHLTQSDLLRELKMRAGSTSVVTAWETFASRMAGAFPATSGGRAQVDLFAIPIVTYARRRRDAATGALFLGQFRDG